MVNQNTTLVAQNNNRKERTYITTKNLTKGMKVPNYKELCRLLEEPVKEGNSKNAQLTEFSRWFLFSRDKNAYVIEELFDIPKEHPDGRARHIQYLEPLILHHLNTCLQTYRGRFFEDTPSYWYVNLGMADQTFYKDKECDKLVQSLSYGQYTLFVLRGIASKKGKEILVGALKNMQRRGLLTYNETWATVDKYNMRRVASSSEVKKLEQMRAEVLLELGCSNMATLFKSPKRYHEYSEKFHQKIATCWRSAFQVIEVIAPPDICAQYQGIDEKKLKEQANKTFCSLVSSEVHRLLKKQAEADKQAWESFSPLSPAGQKHGSFRYPFEFGWNAELLIDQLMFVPNLPTSPMDVNMQSISTQLPIVEQWPEYPKFNEVEQI